MSHLTNTQINHFKQLLDERDAQVREAIRAELVNKNDEESTKLAGKVHDRSEESVAGLLRDLNNALVDRHLNELQQIASAQQRITSGTYGLCIDCEDEIDLQRLENLPTATRCFICQSHHEKTYAQSGHSSL